MGILLGLFSQQNGKREITGWIKEVWKLGDGWIIWIDSDPI